MRRYEYTWRLAAALCVLIVVASLFFALARS
jgi:hypothetical protein